VYTVHGVFDWGGRVCPTALCSEVFTFKNITRFKNGELSFTTLEMIFLEWNQNSSPYLSTISTNVK